MLADDYITAVTRAGGIPLILPILRGGDREALRTELLDRVDGVLFSGGNDVDPLLFGETSTGRTGRLIPDRDEQELWMARYLLEHTRKPILGICRGIQLLNACLGGTLYQDLPTEHPSEVAHTMTPPYDRVIHTVHPLPDAPLAALLGKTELGVNSYHHQAIKDPAPDLVEMARSTDDLIEAVYLPGKTFVWAVQWHPEMSLRADEASGKIFKAFVEATNRRMN